MLDVSDGLLGDLGHILEQSNCGAQLEEAALPLRALHAASRDASVIRAALLNGGDDYELLFCADPAQRPFIEELAEKLALLRLAG